jgi:hypothetical protein
VSDVWILRRPKSGGRWRADTLVTSMTQMSVEEKLERLKIADKRARKRGLSEGNVFKVAGT